MHYGYFDGATEKTNPGNMGIGIALYENQNEVAIGAAPAGFGTNNDSEYAALKWLLDCALSIGIKELKVFGDSQLVINQVTKVWNSSEKFGHSILEIQALMAKFSFVSLNWIPRTKNGRADALSKRGLCLPEPKFHLKRDSLETEHVSTPETAVQKAIVRTAAQDTIKVGKKFAVLIDGGGTYMINLVSMRCSCNAQGCEHIAKLKLTENKAA